LQEAGHIAGFLQEATLRPYQSARFCLHRGRAYCEGTPCTELRVQRCLLPNPNEPTSPCKSLRRLAPECIWLGMWLKVGLAPEKSPLSGPCHLFEFSRTKCESGGTFAHQTTRILRSSGARDTLSHSIPLSTCLRAVAPTARDQPRLSLAHLCHPKNSFFQARG
jgi:hypothetical protein